MPLILREGMDRPDGVTLLAQTWNGSVHCLLPGTGKALLWKGGFCSEIWLLLNFGILSQCSFSEATGIYLVKKQLINLFDLDVEMNHIEFQVRSLSLIVRLLNLSRFILSAYGLLKAYLSSIF